MSSATVCCDTQSKVSSETLLIIYWFLQPHCWINLHTITMISFSNIYCLCSKVESPSLPFKHSACIWSYYGMVIDTYHFIDQSRCTRNDVPCIEWNSYVIQMHRNKRYGKAEKKMRQILKLWIRDINYSD